MLSKVRKLGFFCSKINFKVIDYSLEEHNITADEGEILFKALSLNRLQVASECQQMMQCGKCHCILSPEICESIDYIKPSTSEEDVSHVLIPFTDFSRFSCKTIISKAFENKKIFLINDEVVNNLSNLL